MSAREVACRCAVAFALATFTAPLSAQGMKHLPSSADRPMHQESAQQHQDTASPPVENPPVPEGMTLDEVFDYAESPPPEDYPRPVPDDRIYVFTFFEQVEYREAVGGGTDHAGWEAQGWIGRDFTKFWWKHEGEAVFEGENEGESETDLLYSRLITPFWSMQLGAQYANEWNDDDYGDHWSAAASLQGLAPYKFELDNSLYLSQEGDLSYEFEGEYDLRITQRLVLQPRLEFAVVAQDIPERDLGAGLTDINLDARLRYEIKRKFAPYVGVRYQRLTGETADLAEAAGRERAFVFWMAGLRFAF